MVDLRVRTPLKAVLATALGVTIASTAALPAAHADNRRFNSSVVANVYAVQRQAECTGELTVSPQLLLAAEWHARDLMANRSLGRCRHRRIHTPAAGGGRGFRGRCPRRWPSIPPWRSAGSN